MGTVSWRRGSVCLMASIFLRFTTLLPVSPSLSLSLWKPLSFFRLPSTRQMCNLKVWSRRQKSGLSVHPWGCLPLSHILTLTLLPVVSKRGCKWRRQIQRYPSPPPWSPTRPPRSKTQRPIFRTLSDKHDLIVDLSPFRKKPAGRRGVVYQRLRQDCWWCRTNNLQSSDHTLIELVWQEGNRHIQPKHLRNTFFFSFNPMSKLNNHVRNHIGIMSHITPKNKHSGRCSMRVYPYYIAPQRQTGAQSSSFETYASLKPLIACHKIKPRLYNR